MKPRFPINTGKKVTQAREYLGLTKVGLARALRLGAEGRRTVRRIEHGENPVSGPMQVALEALVQGKVEG